eukprot:m.104782 g.104782  ORF g.104782 m.104782 type:complete len:287 (+) comp9114_c0_seq1:802-1662(+)
MDVTAAPSAGPRGRQNTSLVASVGTFVRKPKVATFIGFWILGLYLCLYATAPVQITPEMQTEFLSKLREAENVEGWDEAAEAMQEAHYRYEEVYVWFWRFRSPYNKLVPERYAELQDAERRFDGVNAERMELLRDANAIVGLWSSHGVETARQMFWERYQGGKDFAKRQSFFDLFFLALTSREEGFGELLVRFVLEVAFNFTIGLVISVISFAFGLWSLIVAYKASFLSGLVFFLVCMLAASAFVWTFIFLMYGSIAGGGYLLVRHAALEQQRRAQLRSGRHYHSD